MTDPIVNPVEASTSSNLLQRVRLRDEAAWQRLVCLYGPLVCLWCRHAGLNDQDVEDVGQEVFLAVQRKIAEFRWERPGDSFRGWLRIIVRNKILDLRKSRQHAQAVGGSSHQERLAQTLEPDLELEASVEVQVLAGQVLELLRAEYREERYLAFCRLVLERHPADEVAHDLGISVNALYLLRSRMLRRVRDELGDLLDGAAG